MSVPRSDCKHLGPEQGLRRCGSCKGNVRQRVFACAVHGTTTLLDCKACPDYKPGGKSVAKKLTPLQRQRMLAELATYRAEIERRTYQILEAQEAISKAKETIPKLEADLEADGAGKPETPGNDPAAGQG